jgi:cytochrome c-type biogenesis protein CcmH
VTLWLVLGAITLLSVGMLLRPLLRGAKAMPAREAYDLEVYRDQLAEVGREEARGILTPSDARAAEREIARRLLAVTPDDHPAAAAAALDSGRVARRWTVLGLATTMSLAALGLYLVVGTPGAPDAPFAARSQAMQSEDMPDINVALPRLEARLKAKPDDLEGWLLLARSYDSLDRYADAVDAYAHALALSNNRPDVVAAYAESKVLQEGGVVTPETRKLFEDVRAKDPESVPARYYLGLVKVQEGDAEAGVRDWLAIQAAAPPDAPWLPGLHGEIERVAQEFKLDLAKLVPPGTKIVPPMAAPLGTGAEADTSAGAAPGAPGGPSAADVAAAQSMTDEQRSQMIRGMVDQLAARLRQQPDDVEGWRRLARAYTVLGEQDKAADAQAHVAKIEGQGAAEPTIAAPGEPGGPSAADVAAAQNMTDEQRSQMIRGMVDQLAARLRQQPDDVEGWQRLARAYTVLGEQDKAADALSHAAQLAPKDPDLLVSYGNALLALGTPGAEPPAKAIEVMRQALEIDARRPEALWVVGLAEAAHGDKSAAAALWSKLLPQLSPGTPKYLEVKERLDGLGVTR